MVFHDFEYLNVVWSSEGDSSFLGGYSATRDRKKMSATETEPLLRNNGETSEEHEPLTGCGGTICCNPHRAVHRYLVLIIMCFLGFGKRKTALDDLGVVFVLSGVDSIRILLDFRV